MKKTIQVEAIVCDKCGDGRDLHSCYSCLNCGMDMCYGCLEKYGIKYSYAVYFSGSGDGYYCINCDNKLKTSGKDELWNAYFRIHLLKKKSERFGKNFQFLAKQAEKDVEKIKNERNKNGSLDS